MFYIYCIYTRVYFYKPNGLICMRCLRNGPHFLENICSSKKSPVLIDPDLKYRFLQRLHF